MPLLSHPDRRLSIVVLEIRGKGGHKLFSTHEHAWYKAQAFAKDKGDISWHLVRRDVVRDSTYKTWWQQQRLLGMNERRQRLSLLCDFCPWLAPLRSGFLQTTPRGIALAFG